MAKTNHTQQQKGIIRTAMYTFNSRVRYSETDEDSLLSPEEIIDYFQDCSTFQSEDLGIGIRYLKQNHVAWIVNYWQIDILRRPALGEEIRIGTSPYNLKGFIGERNFMIETMEGRRLVNANSVWALFDTEKCMLTKVFPEMSEKYELFPKFDMEYTSRKIKLPKIMGMETQPVEVSRQHLDSNHHVNNGQYIRIALHAAQEAGDTPAGGRSPYRIRAEYKKQARLGDTIYPTLYCTEAPDLIIAALNGKDGLPYAVIEFDYE